MHEEHIAQTDRAGTFAGHLLHRIAIQRVRHQVAARNSSVQPFFLARSRCHAEWQGSHVIALLGWGSLVWDPGELPIHRRWHTDGPYVQAEFLRQSDNGRLTLVLSRDAAPVRSLWATYAGTNLNNAREALCDREGVARKNLAKSIASWSRGDASHECVLELEGWATARGISSVVWTALPPKFNGKRFAAPTIDEALQYLSGLTGPTRDLAERYVRNTPRQIDTVYRRRIEAALNWSFVENL
jgi:hypothetical protein